ncbi:MAG: LuxR C-terminal-related transcriptional regulator [Dehalococcoidia bacterium]
MTVSEGRAALARADWPAAQAAFEAALAGGASPEAHDGLGETLWWLNEIEAAHEHRAAAFRGYRARGDRRKAARLAAWLGREQVFLAGNSAAMHGWFARANRLLEEGEPGVEDGWCRLLQASMTLPPAGLERAADEAARIARAEDDPDLEAFALAFGGLARVFLGRVDEGMRSLDEAMTAATSGELQSYATVSEIFCVMLSACAAAGDLVRTDQWTRTAEAFAQRHACPFLAAVCQTVYGGLLTVTGRWDAAEAQLVAAIASFERGHRALRGQAVVQLADLRVAQGRLEEAEVLLDGYEDQGAALLPLARLQLARGHPELARAAIEQAIDLTTPALDQAGAIAVLVEAALAAGDLALAERGAVALSTIADAAGSDLLRAQALLARGRIANASGDREALAILQSALRLLRSYEQSLIAGRTRLELARTARTADPPAAITWARAALATFQRLGATNDADQAAALLRQLGVSGRSGPRSRQPLTQREGEVLALIAHGLNNREIATRLVISPKTAEHHVSQVLAKLGARSRAEAAALARAGHLPE